MSKSSLCVKSEHSVYTRNLIVTVVLPSALLPSIVSAKDPMSSASPSQAQAKDQGSLGGAPSRPGLNESESHSSDSSGETSSSNNADDAVAYHPPNLAQLKAMIRSPTRGLYSGNSLLYSTSGFDMLNVITRVGKSSYLV